MQLECSIIVVILQCLSEYQHPRHVRQRQCKGDCVLYLKSCFQSRCHWVILSDQGKQASRLWQLLPGIEATITQLSASVPQVQSPLRDGDGDKGYKVVSHPLKMISSCFQVWQFRLGFATMLAIHTCIQCIAYEDCTMVCHMAYFTILHNYIICP